MNPSLSRYPFAGGLAEELLSKSAEAVQFERNNPALFCLTLAYGLQRRLSKPAILKLFVLRRRDILSRLKLIPEEWAARQASKISIPQCQESDLRLLKKCLRSKPFLERLKFFTELPFTFAEALLKHGDFASSLFIRNEISHAGKNVRAQSAVLAKLYEHLFVYRETLALGKKLGLPGVEIKLQNLVSATKLLEVRSEWKQLAEDENPYLLTARQVVGRKIQTIPFPPAILSGRDGIRPIQDPDELLDEGREMRHCVGTYASRIYKRVCDIYGVRFKDERATIEVLLKRGRPVLGEVKSFQNRPVSSALRRFVEAWFEGECRTELP